MVPPLDPLTPSRSDHLWQQVITNAFLPQKQRWGVIIYGATPLVP